MNVYLFIRLFKCLFIYLFKQTFVCLCNCEFVDLHKFTNPQMHNQSFHLSFTPITVCSVVLLSRSVRMGNRQYSVWKPACVTMPCGVKV